MTWKDYKSTVDISTFEHPAKTFNCIVKNHTDSRDVMD